MKVTLILTASLLALLAVAGLPAFDGSEGVVTPRTPAAAPGRLLEGGEASGAPCRLVVEGGPRTRVDRGALRSVGTRREIVGAYRYWDEPQGRILYVYDDVQDLLGRIVNPRAVRVLD